mgnify:CR=1 FL=1
MVTAITTNTVAVTQAPNPLMNCVRFQPGGCRRRARSTIPVWDNVNGVAYVFGGTGSEPIDKIRRTTLEEIQRSASARIAFLLGASSIGGHIFDEALGTIAYDVEAAKTLMDEAGFTKDLETLYRQMWRQYCSQGA